MAVERDSHICSRKRKFESESAELKISNEQSLSPEWRKITCENLDLSYLSNFLPHNDTQLYFENLEKEIEYLVGNLAKVRVYGKWHDLPRQQAAYGDTALKYTYSGCTVPARPWTPTLLQIKSLLEKIVPHEYNFCLINRYKNGSDYIGEHRDDEKELDKRTPIASVSIGQHRDFIFRHKDARDRNVHGKVDSVRMVLCNGSLLLMNEPTNTYWYHSLPRRKKLPGVRINLTFRKIIQ